MRHLIAFILVLALPGIAGADASDRTRELAETMKKIVSAPEGKTLTSEQRSTNCRAWAELDGLFDYDAIIGTALASIDDKLGKERSTTFHKRFRELIRMIAYPDSGGFFRRATYTVSPARVKGDTATVEMETSIEEEDFRNTVTFAWKKQGGDWRITDISFDNASLVKDYRNQFSRIVEKEGADGLMKRLDAKYEEESAKRLTCGN